MNIYSYGDYSSGGTKSRFIDSNWLFQHEFSAQIFQHVFQDCKGDNFVPSELFARNEISAELKSLTRYVHALATKILRYKPEVPSSLVQAYYSST